MERHFTVSGFLSHDGRTALHWHRLGMWLPPGGHIHPNEDPVEAVLREVEEETGVTAIVVRTAQPYPHEHPRQLPPPVTIGVYNIDEPGNPHQHIDLVYFTRPRATVAPKLPRNHELWRWVSSEELNDPGVALDGQHGPTPLEEDVRRLGLDAIAAVHAIDADVA